MSHSVRLIWSTPNAEHVIEYCARASSPKNQEKMDRGELTPGKLLKYCADAGHWSIFETANACFEICTTRAISAQILRHRSFSFQEMSQRYRALDEEEFTVPEMRLGGTKNRQSSSDVMDDGGLAADAVFHSVKVYEALLEKGAAPETARMVLPMCSPTKMYMNGTIRSWIHYLDVRCKPNVQKEHRLIALDIRSELSKLLPACSEAFGWGEV